ncbi:hypothetical protein [Rhodopseudomonas palustris]|uniref:Uncharacterized protein n=1 Tax=Rhodopseudomonas palustris (strain BisB18) TaxID=316056 RepID=Q20ZM2_RHOPB
MVEKMTAVHGVQVSETTRTAVGGLEQQGRKVQVIGRIVNGKVELDQASLNEMAKKFPNAEMAFVAVNAPFDPISQRADGAPAN